MKTTFTFPKTHLLSLMFSLTIFSFQGFSQSGPKYKFKNPELIVGNNKEVGAVYLFRNVTTSVDALVEVKYIGPNITLRDIDRTSDGYGEAFQPEYKISGRSNDYIDLKISFITPYNGAGTYSPSIQPLVQVSALDIDGELNGGRQLKEYNTIDMGGSGGVATFNTVGSELSLQKNGSAFTGANITGVRYGVLVDTAALPVMFSVSNAGVTSLDYRIGSDNQMNGNGNRYSSLYFKAFDYPNISVLSVPNLKNFSGFQSGSTASLKWELTNNNVARHIVLEKSVDNGNSFAPVNEYWVNMEGSTQKEFSFADVKQQESNSFYRLKIQTVAGKTEYSNVVSFRAEKSQTSAFTVYPSLVTTSLTANLTSSVREQGSFEVFDYTGKKVFTKPVNIQSGVNNIYINELDKLPSGQYITVIRTTDKVYNQKIQKL